MCRSEYLEIVVLSPITANSPPNPANVSPLPPPTPCSKFTFNMEMFELVKDTTYDLYSFAVRSNRVSTPEYPLIRIMFGSERPDSRRHRHCPGGTVRGRGHETAPSAPLSTPSRLWLTLRYSYCSRNDYNLYLFYNYF